MRQIANLFTVVTRSGGSNPLPIVMAGSHSWLSAPALKSGDRDERSVGSNPTPAVMVDIV